MRGKVDEWRHASRQSKGIAVKPAIMVLPVGHSDTPQHATGRGGDLRTGDHFTAALGYLAQFMLVSYENLRESSLLILYSNTRLTNLLACNSKPLEKGVD
jgi:hypothetical protein